MVEDLPAEGTRLRSLLDHMLNSVDTSSTDVMVAQIYPTPKHYNAAIKHLCTAYGYDIRIIRRESRKTGRKVHIHKIIGRRMGTDYILFTPGYENCPRVHGSIRIY